MTLKVVPKAACDHENRAESKPRMYCTMEKIEKRKRRKAEKEICLAYGTIYRIIKCFKRSKQKLNIYFSHNKAKI